MSNAQYSSLVISPSANILFAADIVMRKINSLLLFMISTPKSVCNIARVTAVLALRITIRNEIFAAERTREMIHSLSVDKIKTGVPPLVPASIRAEFLFLPAGILYNWLTASHTFGAVKIIPLTAHAVSTAVSLDSIGRYPRLLADLLVPQSFLSQLCYVCFFLICHTVGPQYK